MIGIIDYKNKQGLEIPVYHSVQFGEQNPNGDDAKDPVRSQQQLPYRNQVHIIINCFTTLEGTVKGQES